MEALFRVCLSNAMVALVLAAAAAVAGRLRVRPSLVHGLWVLVLIQLVTPPIGRPLAMPGRAWRESAAPPGQPIAPPPGRLDDPEPAKPTGEVGKRQFQQPRRAQTYEPAVSTARRLIAGGRLSPFPARTTRGPGGGKGGLRRRPLHRHRRHHDAQEHRDDPQPRLDRRGQCLPGLNR